MKLKLERSPYKHFLDEDEEFKGWFENLERASLTTASEYIRRVGHVCTVFELTPEKLAAMSEKEAGSFLLKIISHFEKKGSKGTNIKGYSRSLKSWWSFR